MAGVPRSYKKNIAEGSGILIFSILFAFFIRAIYLFSFNNIEVESSGGYLWEPISFLFANPYISSLASSIMTAGLAFLAAHINTIHLLIRRKSLLPPAFIVLLFSCHPIFIVMSAEYISALLLLVIINMLFSAYHSEDKQKEAFKVSFILALASMFIPVSIVYYPMLLIALGIMRCFNFKAFIASLLGVFIVYFPAFSYYLLTENMEGFLAPFKSIDLESLGNFSFFSYSIVQWILLGFSILLMITIISDDYINRHKDKIRVRAYLSSLLISTIFSMLAFVFINITPLIHVYVTMTTAALLFAHFFALAEIKATVILFYIALGFYLIVCFLPFLSI